VNFDLRGDGVRRDRRPRESGGPGEGAPSSPPPARRRAPLDPRLLRFAPGIINLRGDDELPGIWLAPPILALGVVPPAEPAPGSIRPLRLRAPPGPQLP